MVAYRTHRFRSEKFEQRREEPIFYNTVAGRYFPGKYSVIIMKNCNFFLSHDEGYGRIAKL